MTNATVKQSSVCIKNTSLCIAKKLLVLSTGRASRLRRPNKLTLRMKTVSNYPSIHLPNDNFVSFSFYETATRALCWLLGLLHLQAFGRDASHLCTQGNRCWALTSWSSLQTNLSCWERGWWRYRWRICCCRLSQTASETHACDSVEREWEGVRMLSFPH